MASAYGRSVLKKINYHVQKNERNNNYINGRVMASGKYGSQYINELLPMLLGKGAQIHSMNSNAFCQNAVFFFIAQTTVACTQRICQEINTLQERYTHKE